MLDNERGFIAHDAIGVNSNPSTVRFYTSPNGDAGVQVPQVMKPHPTNARLLL